MDYQSKKSTLNRRIWKKSKTFKELFSILNRHENANKISVRYHLIPVRMTNFKNTTDSLCWKGYRVRNHASIAGWSANLTSQLGNQYCNLRKDRSINLKTQVYHSSEHIQRMLNHTTRTLLQQCSCQHYSK